MSSFCANRNKLPDKNPQCLVNIFTFSNNTLKLTKCKLDQILSTKQYYSVLWFFSFLVLFFIFHWVIWFSIYSVLWIRFSRPARLKVVGKESQSKGGGGDQTKDKTGLRPVSRTAQELIMKWGLLNTVFVKSVIGSNSDCLLVQMM